MKSVVDLPWIGPSAERARTHESKMRSLLRNNQWELRKGLIEGAASTFVFFFFLSTSEPETILAVLAGSLTWLWVYRTNHKIQAFEIIGFLIGVVLCGTIVAPLTIGLLKALLALLAFLLSRFARTFASWAGLPAGGWRVTLLLACAIIIAYPIAQLSRKLRDFWPRWKRCQKQRKMWAEFIASGGKLHTQTLKAANKRGKANLWATASDQQIREHALYSTLSLGISYWQLLNDGKLRRKMAMKRVEKSTRN